VEELFFQHSLTVPNAGVRDTNAILLFQELLRESFLGSERKGAKHSIAKGGLSITANIKYPIL
jgi:hypothetical protein